MNAHCAGPTMIVVVDAVVVAVVVAVVIVVVALRSTVSITVVRILGWCFCCCSCFFGALSFSASDTPLG